MLCKRDMTLGEVERHSYRDDSPLLLNVARQMTLKTDNTVCLNDASTQKTVLRKRRKAYFNTAHSSLLIEQNISHVYPADEIDLV